MTSSDFINPERCNTCYCSRYMCMCDKKVNPHADLFVGIPNTGNVPKSIMDSPMKEPTKLTRNQAIRAKALACAVDYLKICVSKQGKKAGKTTVSLRVLMVDFENFIKSGEVPKLPSEEDYIRDGRKG